MKREQRRRPLHPGARRTGRRRAHGRRGTAIVEFAACSPLLALVIVVTFFFGWAMVNQQHVWSADRYAAWRQVRTGAAPTDDDLNRDFFAGRARNVVTDRDGGTSTPEQDFVDDVAGQNGPAGDLASGLVMDRFPKGLGVRAQGEFPSDVTVWQRYAGAIKSRSARIGVEWRWRQARCETVVADQLFPTLDMALQTMPPAATGMGGFLRSLYRNNWDFHDWPYGTDGNAN